MAILSGETELALGTIRVKYDVVTLIQLLESRPCFWDKTADCFKDKIENRSPVEKFM